MMQNILGTIDSDSNDERPRKRVARTATKAKINAPATKVKQKAAPDPVKRREKQKQKQAKKDLEDRKVYAGIDLGATHSGVAWVSNSKDHKLPTVITKWGMGNDSLLQKTPSVIAYAEDNEKQGDENWIGTMVKPGSVSYSWFKLRLDENTPVADFDDPLLKEVLGSKIMELPEGKTAEDVMTDYLKPFREHIINHLKTVFGAGGYDNTPIVFCVTVPAVWGRAARNSTRKAVIRAGFKDRGMDELLMMDEPEAGIIDVLHTSVVGRNLNQQIFKAGECVLAVDGGGGTCDLIAYNLIKLSPLQIEEAAVGDGGKCGASAVDRGFWQWCRELFGAAFESVSIQHRTTGSKFMQEFENHKQRFEGVHSKRQDDEMFIPLRMPGLDLNDDKVRLHYDTVDFAIRLTNKDMERFFEPVLQGTEALIKNQFEAVRQANMPEIKQVVLIGGLSNSPYFEYRLRKFIREEFGRNINVTVPEDATSAVCRGAAIHARDQNIVAYRKSRDSLGILCHEKFDATKHDERDKIIIKGAGERAEKQMKWSIQRGEKIDSKTKVAIEFRSWLKESEINSASSIYQSLYACSDDAAPSRLDDTCIEIGRLKLDLKTAAIARKKELKAQNNNVAPKVLDLDVKLEWSAGLDKGMLNVKGTTGTRSLAGRCEVEFYSDSKAGVKQVKPIKVKRARSED